MPHIQAAVIGASGYSGAELSRLLRRHPSVRAPRLFRLHANDRDETEEGGHVPPGNAPDERAGVPSSNAPDKRAGVPYGNASIERFDPDRVVGADVLFFCTPHAVSRHLVPRAIADGHRVVDLSGAWRLKSAEHRAVYAFSDSNQGAAAALDEGAVYGLPELHRDAIAAARLVASAGCYATSIILALSPWLKAGLVDLDHGVISDSKSGVSGAGKEPTPRTHFVEVSDNLSTYSVFGHRHTGEVLEQLGIAAQQFQFTPHLLPIPRGILSTIYVRAARGATAGDLEATLREFYADRHFVRVLGHGRLPEIKPTLHTNCCDIGFTMEPGGNRVVLVSCLDNLVKGAAGQAVQNMNLMFGLEETEGLL